MYVSREFAACRGVLTSLALGMAARGSALRAVTALLQAEQVPRPSVTSSPFAPRQGLAVGGRTLRCVPLLARLLEVCSMGGGRFAAPRIASIA